MQNNLKEIQDQIVIFSKREIKVQIEKGNKSPKRKGEIKVQIKIGKSKLVEKKESFLRSRCKIAIKKKVEDGPNFCGLLRISEL